MSGSYERINYALRPAKCIERKMLCEAFRRLSDFRLVESYRYVGFGSPYFSDFNLFHKELNICAMNSIEHDTENTERFLFNRPFKCIEINFGESNEILPQLPWGDICTLTWLDYDGALNNSVLEDIKHITANSAPGSLIIISVNAHPYQYKELPTERLDTLREYVGVEKVPANVAPGDLNSWGLAKISRRIVQNEIDETLTDRNAIRPSGQKILYRQLFNFHYSDGAKMLTVGGILYDEGQLPKLESCAFGSLPFIKNNEEPYLIEVPNLTLREIRQLNAQLPTANLEELDAPGVPKRDIERYAQVYRYFPTFTEADI
ncbi:MAG: hypothetical protein VR67_17025 [Peptococcaceae bacterium BRH_c8a]|nr:MAG: hypothetical protein VR67_17025 [Peptococcaceae bacterium BRH_c8a]